MKPQDYIHLILLIALYLIGMYTGRMTSDGLEVVTRNTGECKGCGAKTVVEIRERR